MYRPYLRTLIIFGAIFFLLVFVFVKIFFGGGDKPKPNPTPSAPIVKPLPEYADSFATVSMTIDGQINGEDKHRGIRITVDRFQRKVEILGGYNQNILSESKFENNETAYDIFLRALRNNGFTSKRPNVSTDERGQCSLGTRTIFELRDSGDTLSKAWTTSCGSKTGNLAGNSSSMRTLFQRQITDYNKLTADVDL